MAFCAPGGDVMLQGMLQAFSNIVDFGLLPRQAAEAPRIATLSFRDPFYPNVHDQGRLSVEARIGMPIREDLQRRGLRVALWSDFEFDAAGVSVVMDLAPPEGGAACSRREPIPAVSAMLSADSRGLRAVLMVRHATERS
jgi:gamma-glutamyltranspeptidase